VWTAVAIGIAAATVTAPRLLEPDAETACRSMTALIV